MERTREFYENLMKECATNLQGYYGRLYNTYLYSDDEVKDAFCYDLNEHSIKDMMDFIMYIEG